MTFRQKVTLLPAVATVFLVAILVVSVVYGDSTSRLHERIGRGLTPALLLLRGLEARVNVLHREVREACAAGDASRLGPLREQARALEEALAAAKGNPVVDGERLMTLQDALTGYSKRAEQALELAGQGAPQAASALQQAEVLHRELLQKLHDEGEQARHQLEEAYAGVVGLHRSQQAWLLALSGLCLLAMGGLCLWVVRQVVEPLSRLTRVTSLIASEGDLTQPIDVRSNDEIGQLARSIEALVARLRTLPVTLQSVLDELSAAGQRLNEASQGQLAFLTNQSRSLSEAGTTMTEIAQTSNLAASRAERVLKVAAQADEFSAAGQQSIESSAAGLQQIRQRVEALVDSIALLSEQAVRAGEIIGSVRDLADQSNVLALNASIEAARSGTEGRGFAVVAREMRALSGQSLQSTQRIGKILSEINQAIRRTVSIAEEDSHKLEEGITQVFTSADKLREITTVVQESSQAARQIVASVTQQNAGIAQMTEVMTVLSQTMGEVVESTMNAEEAVGQVNTTLERLKEVVASFRV